LDGTKVCEAVRTDEKLKDTSILAISGYDPEITGPQALAAGADVFLAKPFRPDQLQSKPKNFSPARSPKPFLYPIANRPVSPVRMRIT
jgi:CheY-like chemotaxis protein